MPTAVDTRVPDGAPWSISDDTGAMYEVRFDDVPGVPVMVYKGIYSGLCGLYRITTGLTAKQARQFVDEIVNPPQPRYEEIPEGGVVVDRARFERLLNAARFTMRVWQIRNRPEITALLPTDLDPLP